MGKAVTERDTDHSISCIFHPDAISSEDEGAVSDAGCYVVNGLRRPALGSGWSPRWNVVSHAEQ